MDIEVGEGAHDDLAIHAVGNTTMAWNQIGKVLDGETRTLILMALFMPEAKNPPKGAIILANREMNRECACSLVIVTPIKGTTTVSKTELWQLGKLKGIKVG